MHFPWILDDYNHKWIMKIASQLSVIKFLKEASRCGIISGNDPCGLAVASICVAAFQHEE
ncbi:hypothetical protein WKT22_00259 [Candidatus Lokiarchaeum ossiferum]